MTFVEMDRKGSLALKKQLAKNPNVYLLLMTISNGKIEYVYIRENH